MRSSKSAELSFLKMHRIAFFIFTCTAGTWRMLSILTRTVTVVLCPIIWRPWKWTLCPSTERPWIYVLYGRDRQIPFPDVHGRRGTVPPFGCHGRDALSLLSTSVEGCTSHQYWTSMLGVTNPVKIFPLSSIEGNALSIAWEYMEDIAVSFPKTL